MSDQDKPISTDLIDNDKKLIDEKSKIKDKKNEEKKPLIKKVYEGEDFGYLKRKNNISSLYTQPPVDVNNLQKYNGNYYYLITILIPSDSKDNSILLKTTLDSIDKNMAYLEKLEINAKDILILLFFENVKTANLFKNQDFNLNFKQQDYIYIECKAAYNDMKNTFDTIALTKNGISSVIEHIKTFYNDIVPDIKKQNGFIYTSVFKNGIIFNEEALSHSFLLLNDNHNKGSIVVPSIESIPQGIYSNINQYENVHFNLYDLSYYDMASSVPINSFFNVMKINTPLLEDIQKFYKEKIKDNNCSIYYHDYSMSIYLKKLIYDINYLTFVTGYFYETDIEYTDYLNKYIQKYSGYYANFFNLLDSFLTFAHCDILKKIILFFQIIGMILLFFFPSLSTMVVYTIFYECFNIKDGRTAAFFSIVYFCFLIFAGVTYKKTNTQSILNMNLISFFFLIFFEIYYIFILVCSVIAMNNVKKNKSLDRYKFNEAAISVIIVLNFAFGVLPMIFLIEKIIPNIVNMFLYLLLGAPSSNSVFLMAYLFNSTDHSGGKNIEEQNGFMIIVFFLFNLLFEGLIFFNTDRSQRVKAVLILSIIFTVYNFFKQLGIILRIFTVGKKLEDILRDKNNLMDIWKKNRELKGIIGENNNNNGEKVNKSNDEEGIEKQINDINISNEENQINNNNNEDNSINQNKKIPDINNYEEEGQEFDDDENN